MNKKELKLHQNATEYLLNKIIEKLETIPILQVNTKMQHIVYII